MSPGSKLHLKLATAALAAACCAASGAIAASGTPIAAARPPAAQRATLTSFTAPAGPMRPAAVSQASGHRNRKKGVGVWPFPGSRSALAKSGASWYYTWSTNHNGISTPPGVSFVPMIRDASKVTSRRLREARRHGHILLGFNEPDLSRQANMSVSEALNLWPRLMATGMRLGSPAVAGGADQAGGWLDQFMQGAAARHYRVDFITLHRYGSDFQTRVAVAQLKSYIQAVWRRYHKPIWLTEFALWKFSPSRTPSPPVQASFLTAATRMLQSLPYVWRYAWFALPANAADGSTGLYNNGAIPTAAGRAFQRVH